MVGAVNELGGHSTTIPLLWENSVITLNNCPDQCALLCAFSVKYEDPQALGGLASALDVRQQNTGGGVSLSLYRGGVMLDICLVCVVLSRHIP